MSREARPANSRDTAGGSHRSSEYGAVAEHVRRLHEPAFDRPHHVANLVTTADASRVVVTGSVYDELDGLFTTNISGWGLRFLDNADPEQIG